MDAKATNSYHLYIRLEILGLYYQNIIINSKKESVPGEYKKI